MALKSNTGHGDSKRGLSASPLQVESSPNIIVVPTEEVKQEIPSVPLLFLVVLLSPGRLSDRYQIDQLTLRDNCGKSKWDFLLYSSEGENHSERR